MKNIITMQRMYNFDQQVLVCIFLVSLVLQSCFNITNSYIPSKKDQTDSTKKLADQISQLSNKELTAEGEHLVTLYQQDGQLQADVELNLPAGFSKTYTRLQVDIAKNIIPLQLLRLPKEAQKKLIHFTPSKLNHPAS